MWYARRMVSAEVLKLRRNKSQLITTLLMTVGVVVVYFAVVEAFHLYNPAVHGPAGGSANFSNVINILTFIGATGAIVVGARAGSADQSTGVFRDQVATGRSRISLFAARVAGGSLFFLVFILAALVLAVAGTFIFRSGLPVPTWSGIFRNSWVTVVVTLFNLLLALGLASLTLSRSVTVGVLLVWTLFAQRLLVRISTLGGVRKAFPLAAEHALNPDARGPFGHVIPESVFTAVLVLVVWAVALLASGAWRTYSMDA